MYSQNSLLMLLSCCSEKQTNNNNNKNKQKQSLYSVQVTDSPQIHKDPMKRKKSKGCFSSRSTVSFLSWFHFLFHSGGFPFLVCSLLFPEFIFHLRSFFLRSCFSPWLFPLSGPVWRLQRPGHCRRTRHRPSGRLPGLRASPALQLLLSPSVPTVQFQQAQNLLVPNILSHPTPTKGLMQKLLPHGFISH